MLCGCALLAQAPPKSSKRATTATSQALENLENRWVAALKSADESTLNGILADNYVDTDESGNRANKAGVLQALKSGDLKLKSVSVSAMHVYSYGDTAVVTGSSTQDGSYKGQALSPRILFTDTFVRRNGKWVAVASQRTAAH
jgi:hypothetical protein